MTVSMDSLIRDNDRLTGLVDQLLAAAGSSVMSESPGPLGTDDLDRLPLGAVVLAEGLAWTKTVADRAVEGGLWECLHGELYGWRLAALAPVLIHDPEESR